MNIEKIEGNEFVEMGFKHGWFLTYVAVMLFVICALLYLHEQDMKNYITSCSGKVVEYVNTRPLTLEENEALCVYVEGTSTSKPAIRIKIITDIYPNPGEFNNKGEEAYDN